MAIFPYPLTSWTLGGFRTIRKETRFDLGGLNLLVGANSAGKSSVLHSLLLATQTLAAPTADRPLVLNGPQVRLGWADDCVHEEAGSEITIGFGLDPAGLEFGQGRPAVAELGHVEKTLAHRNTRESLRRPRNVIRASGRAFGSTKGKGRRWPALSSMRPTRIELATFGLKDRRSLDPVKGPLTTELRAPCCITLSA
jgi:predicted ATPase